MRAYMRPMQRTVPLTRDLVLIGGGHSHALVLRMWGMNPLRGVRVTVINPLPTAAYSGMLPGFVAGHFTREQLDIDLVRLARFAGARVIIGSAEGIDTEKREVRIAGQGPISYDVVSVDVGITSEMPALPGFPEHGIPAKPLAEFAAKWDAYRTTAKAPKVAVIGAGIAGAELAMAMAHALKDRSGKVTLIDKAAALPGMTNKARAKVLTAMAEAGVDLIENAPIASVGAEGVRLEDGRRIEASFVTGAAGARPHDWIAASGLDLVDGYIAVGPTLRSSDPAIFATGDCAHMTHAPRPKAGVYAVRQAPILYNNLRAALTEKGQMRPYRPQRDYLKLVSLGRRSALAEKFGTAVRGPLLWLWKDRIDRKFMAMLDDLPKMPVPSLPKEMAAGAVEALGDKPMCGGCGAKVGRGALRNALASLPATTRKDITPLPGDDAALLTTGGAQQVITTDHLRSLTNDHALMTRIAAVHALGDIWAMGAKPQAATVNVILPRMSAALQERTMREIMGAANEVISGAGAAIVGGHSSMGDELTIGFTLTGLCEKAPITLGGAKAGDALILTKPVGSGVLMAAEMAGLAPGTDVVAAYKQMLQPQGLASEILGKAHAMTDLTGFGIAGHLSGICEASGVAAEISLDAVPLMQGALALAEKGVRSSLYPDNVSGAGVVAGRKGPLADLMFDPQTAGGLLAAVPADKADELVKKLWLAGYPAAKIGRLIEGLPSVTLI
jgi:selenide,water dikinase